MGRWIVLTTLLLGGCYARGGHLYRIRPEDPWKHASAPANRTVRVMFGWPSPRRAGASRWCEVRFPCLIPDAPYAYDPDADELLIPLPDGGVLRLRGDPGAPPPNRTPSEDQLDDAEAAYRWAFERGAPPPLLRGAYP